ncbi:MAG: IgGFc-binding protein, partial [Chlorobi bacterium]|nr:IgGFc-binding protein [Chlorobiota bacterium]
MCCRQFLCVCVGIAALVAAVSAQQTTRGRDFYVVFMPNYHNEGDNATDSLYIFVVADQPTNGTIAYTNNLGQTQTRNFTISNPQQIFVHRVQYRPYELFGYNNNGTFVTPNENEQISPRVFRVTTDRDVAIYALNQALTTSDATLVLPVTTLGTEYYVMSYNTDGIRNPNGTLSTQTTPSEFVIVGIEDGTDVTVYPTAPTTESGMQVKSVRLDRGQAMLFQAQFSTQNLNYDLTGTRIVATKKIAVFGGHQRALIPVQARGQLASRDHLYEQMIPRSVWGTTYILTPLAEPRDALPAPSGVTDLYRVLAAENGTEIKVNGRVVAVLQRGQFYQAPLTQPALLEASQPVMIALFKRSFSVTSNLTLGDPFMMIIPPRRQYLSKYRFQSCQVAHPSGGNTYYEQYITVVTTPNNVRSILLDGDTLNASFREVPNTCYVYANVRVSDGAHTIESPRLFGLYVYGYGYADSYGYIGGMAFLPDVPDIVVSAGPDHELCLGDSVTIAVTGNAYAVRWSVAPGYPAVTIRCDTCRTITLAPTATTKLILTASDSLGCSVTDDVMITVYGKPQLRVQPDTVVCSDGPVTILAEGVFQTIQWQPTEGLGCSICPQTTVTPQPGKEIVYTAIVRNANSPHCEVRDSIRVRYAPGLLGKVPPVVTLCHGDSIVITLDYGGTVRWTPAQGLSCTDCKTVTIRPQRTTRYTIVGDSSGCTTQASIEVRVVQKPTLAPLPDTSICAGESMQVQLITTNADRIEISPPVEVSCTGCPTPLFTPTQTRTYTITVSAGSGTSECKVTDTMRIVVFPRPTVTLPTASLVLCAGDTVYVVARITDADSIAWEPTDGVLCPMCDSTAIVGTASRTYTVTAWNSAGCSSNATLTVTVNQRPTLDVSPSDTAVCAGTTLLLTATSNGTIEWDRT